MRSKKFLSDSTRLPNEKLFFKGMKDLICGKIQLKLASRIIMIFELFFRRYCTKFDKILKNTKKIRRESNRTIKSPKKLQSKFTQRYENETR